MRVPHTIRLRFIERREAHIARGRLTKLPAADVVTIIPTYRRESALLDAIQSALGQTVRDHAVVVVDDGGGLPDTLPDDPRLFAISLTRNRGTVGITRNVGIRVSHSKFLAFLDDDNLWDPTHLEVSLAAHRLGAELTYTSLRRVGPDGTLINISSVPFDRRQARDWHVADASAIVVDRGKGVFFSRVPRRKGEFPREDWEFVYRLSRRLRVEHVDAATVVYRVHSGSYFSTWDTEPS